MLRKLIKYDLKWQLKIITIYYLLGFVLSIIGRLFEFFPDSTFFIVLTKIIKGAAISLTITGIINCIIRSWVRITNNLYKDESLLTHTLPVETSLHYYSKIISVAILVFLSIGVLIINLIIMYHSNELLDFIRQSFDLLENNYNLNPVGLILLFGIVILVEVFFIIVCGFFGIIFGYSHNNKKLGKSFIYGLVAYGICSVTSLVIMMIFAIFNQNLYNIIFENSLVISFDTFKIIMLLSIVLYIIYGLVLIVLSHKKLNQGVNID